MRAARSCAFLCASIALMILCACGAQVGSTFDQDATRAKLVNPSPHALAQTDGDGQWTATAPTPTTSTSMKPTGEVATVTTGVSRELLASVNGSPWALRSGSDIGIEAAKASFAPDGSVSLEGFRLSTATSEPTRAANEAFDRLAEAWTAVPDASRQVLIEQGNQIRAGLGDLLATALKAAAGVP